MLPVPMVSDYAPEIKLYFDINNGWASVEPPTLWCGSLLEITNS
jgi:hypothetical protein